MDAADAVAEGDLTVKVPEHFPAEFGQLARSFNRMTGELARSEEQRNHLTADVAHELRTPLHIIQGNLEGILDGIYQPTPDHINATLDETRLLARLVDDLQTLTLAEADQLQLNMTRVNLADLLADVTTSFSGQAETVGVALEYQLQGSPEELTLVGDVDRLDQVLSNLVANALRFTPFGGKITLLAEPLLDSGQKSVGVRLKIKDNGTGIPAEDLPFIFDRFWRGDRARTRQTGIQSGLGLAITRQLVRAHGGDIKVESQVGMGTTFTIDIPVE
jgi:two-component system sensor histidine kinase BaeS